MHLDSSEQRPVWLRADRLFGELGIRSLEEAGRLDLERRTEARRAENSEEFEQVRRGWCFGDDQFRTELLERVEGEARGHHFGEEIHEASEAKATRIVDEELRRALWSEAELKLRQKGDPQKIRIARRLRSETTMTLQWVATRLHMGTKTHLSHLLYWQQRAENENQPVELARASAKVPGRKHSGAKLDGRGISNSATSPVPQSNLHGNRAREDAEKIGSPESEIQLTDPDEMVGGFDTSFD